MSTLSEYERLVADFDEAAAKSDWPGHRIIDDVPMPEWMEDETGLDEVIAGWSDDGEDQPTTEGAEVAAIGYRAAHARVAAARGKANEQACADCGGQAAEWSYSHDDPDELTADDPIYAGMPYSTNLEHYAPRCRGCHVKFDKQKARERRGEPTPPAPGWEGRTWAPEFGWTLREWMRSMRGLPDQPVDDVRHILGMHVAAQSEADLDIVALWIAATHLAAHGVGQSFPRLAVVAPSHGSGKSTLLDFVEHLSHHGERIESTVTDALLPRILLQDGAVTLCIDEAEKVLKPENAAAIAILNSGWRRGGTARLNLPDGAGGWAPTKVPTFAPAAMAGNGIRLAEDTLDRTITVRLYRNADPDAIAEADWEVLGPVTGRLRERLARWAEACAGAPTVKRPPLPAGITGRDRDRWQVLASAAEATSRADWRVKVTEACRADFADRQEARAEAGRAPQEQLVHDLHEALPNALAYATEDMASLLAAAIPGRYTGLTTHKLGWQLSKFWGLTSTRRDIAGRRRRGYAREELERAWRQAGVLPVAR